MRCVHCLNLEQAVETRRNEYRQASSLASHSVSKKFAAYMNVEMERALNELEEHRSVCRSAAGEPASVSVVTQIRRKQPEMLRASAVENVV